MKIILGFLLVLLPLLSQAKEECVPNVDSCGFYVCQEKNHSCGPQGYQLGFGFRFCQVFLNSENNYSENAHQWLRRVRVCLMEQFAQAESNAAQRTYGEIKSDAFHSHVGCYLETGFCELRGIDYIQIFWALRASTRHLEIYQDLYGILQGCAVKRELNPEALNAQR